MDIVTGDRIVGRMTGKAGPATASKQADLSSKYTNKEEPATKEEPAVEEVQLDNEHGMELNFNGGHSV